MYISCMYVCLLGFHGMSTFIGYFMPNLFLYKQSVLFQTIKLSTQFNCQKTFLFQAIQFSQTILIQPIQFSKSIDFVYTQLNVKIFLFQTNQFSIQKQFHFK